jgi:hypothetical protein
MGMSAYREAQKKKGKKPLCLKISLGFFDGKCEKIKNPSVFG